MLKSSNIEVGRQGWCFCTLLSEKVGKFEGVCGEGGGEVVGGCVFGKGVEETYLYPMGETGGMDEGDDEHGAE
jgi:hypothetical protein